MTQSVVRLKSSCRSSGPMLLKDTCRMSPNWQRAACWVAEKRNHCYYGLIVVWESGPDISTSLSLVRRHPLCASRGYLCIAREKSLSIAVTLRVFKAILPFYHRAIGHQSRSMNVMAPPLHLLHDCVVSMDNLPNMFYLSCSDCCELFTNFSRIDNTPSMS